MKEKRLYKTFQTITIILISIPMLGGILVPLIFGIFINTDKYIENSKDIALKSYQYIGFDREDDDAGFGNYKYAFQIKRNQTYYAVSYYKKTKNDYGWTGNLSNRENDGIYLKINPIELERHKGTKDDPIPVFNFASEINDYFWSQKSYRYNIKTHLIYEDILHIKSYDNILYVMMGVGIILGLIMYFIEANKDGLEAKRRREKLAERKKKRNNNKLS